jgi:putative salt-induced outer membrane protein
VIKRTALVCLLGLLLGVPVLCAEEPPKPPWSGSLGLSFLSTTGNSETMSFGAEFTLKRVPDPWGLEFNARYLGSSQGGVKNAEDTYASLRGTRNLSERWEAYARASWERDTFAGFDMRAILEAGATFKALTGPVQNLSFDAGLSWTSEEPVSIPSFSYTGAALGLAYEWKISETSALTEKARYFTDFSDTSNWRVASQTALKAAISKLLALKFEYDVRYTNQPVPGFLKTDTATILSLVASL